MSVIAAFGTPARRPQRDPTHRGTTYARNSELGKPAFHFSLCSCFDVSSALGQAPKPGCVFVYGTNSTIRCASQPRQGRDICARLAPQNSRQKEPNCVHPRNDLFCCCNGGYGRAASMAVQTMQGSDTTSWRFRCLSLLQQLTTKHKMEGMASKARPRRVCTAKSGTSTASTGSGMIKNLHEAARSGSCSLHQALTLCTADRIVW